MHRKTAKKEAWRPKRAAPRLGYEHQNATCYCSYLGHQNEFTFVGGISARCPKYTTHHSPIFPREAMSVSAKPSQSGWVGIGRWVWVTQQKKKLRMCKNNLATLNLNNSTHVSNYECKQTKIIKTNTKWKIIIKIGGGILCWLTIMSSWGVVVVGGKTSHLFLRGEDGGW